MKIETTPGALLRFKQSPGKFQHTFKTDLERLPTFVAALLAGTPPITSGTVTIKSVVFEPKHLRQVLAMHAIKDEPVSGMAITASGPEELHSLLIGTFSDWLDFYFTPRPGPFTVYADHDEYTTVFASRKFPISKIATAMALAGIADVPGYARET